MVEPDNLRYTKLPLNNGSGAIPALGFGTLIADPIATKIATKAALEAGFRQLDASERYRNEKEVGEAMQGPVLVFFKGMITRVIVPTVFVAGAAYVFFYPFWASFVPPERNFGLEIGPGVRPQDFIQIFGVYLLVLVPFVLWGFTRERPRRTPCQRRLLAGPGHRPR